MFASYGWVSAPSEQISQGLAYAVAGHTRQPEYVLNRPCFTPRLKPWDICCAISASKNSTATISTRTVARRSPKRRWRHRWRVLAVLLLRPVKPPALVPVARSFARRTRRAVRRYSAGDGSIAWLERKADRCATPYLIAVAGTRVQLVTDSLRGSLLSTRSTFIVASRW